MAGTLEISTTAVLVAAAPTGDAIAFHCWPAANVIAVTRVIGGLGLRISNSTSKPAFSFPLLAIIFTFPIPVFDLTRTSK